MTNPYLPGANAPSSEVIYTPDFSKQYESNFGHDAGLLRLTQRFLTYLPPDAHVLDCGCGTGKPVGHMVAESKRHITGIDLSEEMIKLSRQQVPQGTFELCSMLTYTLPPANFGGITATLSLFEFSRAEITTMAGKWFQWLQPGGHLMICVVGAEDAKEIEPELYDEDGECAQGIPWRFMGYQVCVTLFTKEGWNHVLERAGFEVVETETDLFKLGEEAKSDDEMHYFVIARKPLGG